MGSGKEMELQEDGVRERDGASGRWGVETEIGRGEEGGGWRGK